MAIYYPTGSCSDTGTLPPYNCDPCPTKEFARIRSVALIGPDASFTDYASSSEWTTNVASGDAVVLYRVKGSYTGGETEELDGFGDNETENGNTSHTAQWRDPQPVDNVDFYNALQNFTDWKLVMKTSSKIWVVDAPCTFSVKLNIAEGIKEVVTIDVSVKWTDSVIPTPYAIPDGIFDNCYQTEP